MKSSNIRMLCTECGRDQPQWIEDPATGLKFRKVGFPLENGNSEWMWVIVANADARIGVLNNQPVYSPYELGDQVTFVPGDDDRMVAIVCQQCLGAQVHEDFGYTFCSKSCMEAYEDHADDSNMKAGGNRKRYYEDN